MAPRRRVASICPGEAAPVAGTVMPVERLGPLRRKLNARPARAGRSQAQVFAMEVARAASGLNAEEV